jgi:site-specific recombinase XerD
MIKSVVQKYSINVLHNRRKLAKNAPIEIRVYFDKKQSYLNTQIRVNSNQFRRKYGFWVKNHKNQNEYNKLILNLIQTIESNILQSNLEGKLFSHSMLTGPDVVDKNTCFILFFASEVEKKNITESSKDVYKIALKHLKSSYKTIPFSDITYGWIKGFDENLASKDVSANTRINYLRTLKTFLAEATACGLYLQDLLFQVKRYKIKKEATKRREVSKEDVAKMQNFYTESQDLALVRDVFLFGIYTGLAYSDIVSLQKTDVRTTEHGEVIFKERQKTKQLSVIPITKLFEGKAAAILTRYGACDTIFCFQQSECIVNQNKLRHRLFQIFEKLDINEKYSMHNTRHTFASNLINAGIDKSIIQRMLGHSSPITTDIYAKINIEGIVSAISKMK